MAKKVEKEREKLKKRLRGQLKAVAIIANKHYETVRYTLNAYVETGKWKVESVRDAIDTHLEAMEANEKQHEAQAALKEAALLAKV